MMSRLMLVFIVTISIVSAFNLDVKNPVTFVGRNGSYFGYSLAVHQNNNLKRLLVGAPKEPNPSNGRVTGAAHQCERRGSTFVCSRVNIIPDPEDVDQWIGATVVSDRGTALVCAPRAGDYVRGQCYFSKDSLSSFDLYISPITHPDTTMHENNFCEVGFSAAFYSQTNQIFTGGPSCDSNKGRLFGPQAPLQNLTQFKENSIDISFFTSAIASGRVINGAEGLVASIPFHQNSKFAGKVVVLDTTKKLEVRASLVGSQSGERFGGSLAVTDLNRDGRDDIVVGAPYYTDYSKAEVKYDIGAVYVYYQTSRGSFQPGNPDELILRGQITGGRFGYAVAALGDVNGDGYNDLAVGAPYELSGGNVYIYFGSRNGLRTEAGQVISGNSFYPPKSSLGFSFAVGDFDGNKYSDLIVSAYESDSVVYLPARPVVKLFSELKFTPEYITLEKTDCDLSVQGQQTIKVSCVKLQYCLTYQGESVPTSINADVSIVLDVKQPKANRLLFIDTNEPKLTHRLTMRLNNRQCHEKTVYVKPDIRDKLSTIEVALTSALVQVASPPPLSPILDVYEADGSALGVLSIFKDCGPDLICIPDLQLTASMNLGTYVQGSGERLYVDVSIFNAGEDAFGAEFYLHLPAELSFISTDRNITDSSVLCFPPGDLNGPVLRCEIGNPFSSGKTSRIRIVTQPLPGDDVDSISFSVETNSTNKEDSSTLNDNKKMLNLKFKAETSLQLTGWSRPESLLVNVTALEQESAVLSQYVQFYDIRNKGPSDIMSAEIQIVFPTKTPEGYAISELIAQPAVIEGQAVCDPVSLEKDNKAIVIQCRTDRISRYNRVVIRLSARLASEALIKIKNRDEFNMTSIATANVTGLPFGEDGSAIPTAGATVSFIIKKMAAEQNVLQAMPWWIPVVSAIGATIILAIIVAVLHHYGFFKRNRPPLKATLQSPESEPLQEKTERPTSERDFTVDEDSS